VRLAALFRATALGIALMCWLDPASTIAPPPVVGVDAAIVRSARDERPARDGAPETLLDRARQLTADLAEALGSAGTVRVHEVGEGALLPCDVAQPCVVLTDGAPVAIPSDRKGPITMVSLGQPLANNAELTGLAAEPAHVDGQAVARVTLEGRGLEGRTTRVRVRDGAAIVGEVAHTWSADGAVALDVPWFPVAPGGRRLTARAETPEGDEVTSLDNEIATTVEVSPERWPVIVIERRPSWAATFVRRALEDDRRFELEARTDVAPRVSVSSNATALDARALDRARVVVAGAPDALTTEDVTRLDTFVRQRGGALVLVPDRPFTGPVTRLLHHTWRERLDETPFPAGPLRASEWLVPSGVTTLDRVWAESHLGPSVMSSPAGAGVVLVSGALDAWRHRPDDRSFERFWASAIAALATSVGDVVDLDLVRLAPEAGGEVQAHVRARSVRPMTAWYATAVRKCDDGETVPVRLWPADGGGAFLGRIRVGARTGCRVIATVAGVGEASASLADEPSSHRWTQEDMEAIASRTGGVMITDGNFRPVVQSWLDGRGPDRRLETRYPMRSWWWLLPFAGCLAAEWWLRRRIGLR
jgi:hypothetical protein